MSVLLTCLWQCRYVFSIYWSITTLATVGYGDLSAANTGEAVWSTIFMFVNLALSAYILGTITLLVVRSDEKAGQYREQSNTMKSYGQLNDLPKVRPCGMSPSSAWLYQLQRALDPPGRVCICIPFQAAQVTSGAT